MLHTNILTVIKHKEIERTRAASDDCRYNDKVIVTKPLRLDDIDNVVGHSLRSITFIK